MRHVQMYEVVCDSLLFSVDDKLGDRWMRFSLLVYGKQFAEESRKIADGMGYFILYKRAHLQTRPPLFPPTGCSAA